METKIIILSLMIGFGVLFGYIASLIFKEDHSSRKTKELLNMIGESAYKEGYYDKMNGLVPCWLISNTRKEILKNYGETSEEEENAKATS